MKEINPLELFKLQSKMTWKKIAKEIGIEVCALKQIRLKGSPETKVRTCIAIEKLTNLKPWQYLRGLENLDEITKKLKD